MNDKPQLDLTSYIRSIPDFPKPGILFRDITPLLSSPEAFGESIRQLADHFRGQDVDVVGAAVKRMTLSKFLAVYEGNRAAAGRGPRRT